VLLGSDYTGQILVGTSQKKINVILDTGSSTLAIDGKDFNPAADRGTTTSNIAQEVQYGSGSWVSAVVRSLVGLSNAVSLKNVNLAVTYQESANMFGAAQGIWGLAYEKLNNSYLMPANTWKNKYDADRIVTGKEADLDPYFGQLEEAGIVANKFALYTKRSIVSAATANPATDPLSQGVFVIGGGEEEDQFYTDSFTHVAVLETSTTTPSCSACGWVISLRSRYRRCRPVARTLPTRLSTAAPTVYCSTRCCSIGSSTRLARLMRNSPKCCKTTR
jgi:hypothetical protein